MKIDWLKLLKESKAYCYIKPTKKLHDSGYACFEVGYLTTKGARMDKKLVLGYSDHIWGYNHTKGLQGISMDLLLDGYIRLWDMGNKGNLWWEGLTWVGSTAMLVSIER